MAQPFLGEIQIFAGNFAPAGYALANGQLLPISQNTALFSLYGITYGGDGQTTFGLPDLPGRVPIHAGSGPGLTPHLLGQKGGVEEVTIDETQLGSHGHAMFGDAETVEFIEPAGQYFATGTTMYDAPVDLVPMAAGTVSDFDAVAGPHPNIQPQLALNFIVATSGAFPSRS